jgi:hypothetical protein
MDDGGAGSDGTRRWRGNWRIVELGRIHRPPHSAASCHRDHQVRCLGTSSIPLGEKDGNRAP